MADENDAYAFALELGDQSHECVDFVTGKRRGGLVHDHEPRLGGQGAADRHELPLSYRQVTDKGVEVEGCADARHSNLGDRANLSHIEKDAPLGHLARRYVFRHRQVGEEREVLVNDLNAVTSRVGRREAPNCAPVDRDLATRFGLYGPTDDLNQGRFARTVLSEETVHLANGHVKIEPVQRRDTSVEFRDAAQCEQFGH